nr:MAG TPA: hypothetical protein [Caudoviricetes sp.]
MVFDFCTHNRAGLVGFTIFISYICFVTYFRYANVILISIETKLISIKCFTF